jgi:hypothetical protein
MERPSEILMICTLGMEDGEFNITYRKEVIVNIRDTDDRLGSISGCPGTRVASDEFYLVTAQMCALFNLKRPLDEAGREYMPTVEWTSGTIRYEIMF